MTRAATALLHSRRCPAGARTWRCRRCWTSRAAGPSWAARRRCSRWVRPCPCAGALREMKRVCSTYWAARADLQDGKGMSCMLHACGGLHFAASLTPAIANMCKASPCGMLPEAHACRLISLDAVRAHARATCFHLTHMAGPGGVRPLSAPLQSYSGMPAWCGRARPQP